MIFFPQVIVIVVEFMMTKPAKRTFLALGIGDYVFLPSLDSLWEL
jgi:hypothetical protein